MTGRRKRRSRSGPLLSLIAASTPLAGACAVCAALYYGLRVRPLNPQSEKPHDSTRCVLVPPVAAGDTSSWERYFYVWADLLDPTLLVLPNEKLGFSRERPRVLEISVASVPDYGFQVNPKPEVLPGDISLVSAAPQLPAKLASVWAPSPPSPPEPVLIQPLRRGIFWRHPDGRLLAKPPQVDPNDVGRAIAEETLPKYPTALQVSRPAIAGVARVKVTRSCGNSRLDQLAVTALRKAVADNELRERYTGMTSDTPGYFPVAGDSVPIEVEWSPNTVAAVGAEP